MAKILVLNGSPHKSASTTMAVTNAFVKGMCEGGEYFHAGQGLRASVLSKMMTCRQLRKE